MEVYADFCRATVLCTRTVPVLCTITAGITRNVPAPSLHQAQCEVDNSHKECCIV